MALRRLITLTIALGLLAALSIGCGSPAPQSQAPAQVGEQNSAASNAPAAGATPEKINVEVGPDEAQIFLLEPEDESGVDSPFYLRVGVSNFKIPISDVKIYVAIDAACTPAGQAISEDAQRVSLPQGVLENSRFELPLGPHRLCIQAANRDDIALQGPGMTRVIDVTVESVRQPSDD
jgi:hypothetical protein